MAGLNAKLDRQGARAGVSRSGRLALGRVAGCDRAGQCWGESLQGGAIPRSSRSMPQELPTLFDVEFCPARPSAYYGKACTKVSLLGGHWPRNRLPA